MPYTTTSVFRLATCLLSLSAVPVRAQTADLPERGFQFGIQRGIRLAGSGTDRTGGVRGQESTSYDDESLGNFAAYAFRSFGPRVRGGVRVTYTPKVEVSNAEYSFLSGERFELGSELGGRARLEYALARGASAQFRAVGEAGVVRLTPSDELRDVFTFMRDDDGPRTGFVGAGGGAVLYALSPRIASRFEILYDYSSIALIDAGGETVTHAGGRIMLQLGVEVSAWTGQ